MEFARRATDIDSLRDATAISLEAAKLRVEAVGVSDRLWEISDIAQLAADPEEAPMARGPYEKRDVFAHMRRAASPDPIILSRLSSRGRRRTASKRGGQLKFKLTHYLLAPLLALGTNCLRTTMLAWGVQRIACSTTGDTVALR